MWLLDERVDIGAEGQRFEYRLTEKGEALLPILSAMREWSDDSGTGRQQGNPQPVPAPQQVASAGALPVRQ